ncbi:hypothetical protein Btru_064901 [Bulinus truncatus]|nr:hypothetical protein Btru_064901 [Bulinus truncatus]
MAGYPKDLQSKEESTLTVSATVFQCENCRTILGDSSTLIYTCEPLATITIQAVQPSRFRIQKRYEKSVSSNALLDGSSFKRVYCSKCSHEVGKIFKNLPSHLTLMADHISLDVQKITSYEIPNTQRSQKQDSNEILLKIQQEILKIQVVLINLNQRLESIENTLALEEESSDDCK